jgi:hypothetical protein
MSKTYKISLFYRYIEINDVDFIVDIINKKCKNINNYMLYAYPTLYIYLN